MTSPLFSIVTPTLNSEAYLPECLASVASQGESVEHIVVDGGSTDRTVSIATAAQCRVIRGPDDGIYDALGKGLAEASAPWFVHLNADDLLLPGALTAWRSLIDDQVDVVQGVATLFEGDPSMVLRTYRQGVRGLDPRDATLGNPVVNARAIRTALLRSIGGYDASYRVAGDREMVLRLIAATPPVRSSDEAVYAYRRHAGSLTFSRSEEVADVLHEHVRIASSSIGTLSPEGERCLRAWRSRELLRLFRRKSRLRSVLRVALAGGVPAFILGYVDHRRGVCEPESW